MIKDKIHRIYNELHRFSLCLQKIKIKYPTRYGWISSYLYLGGLGYLFSRPSEKKILQRFNPPLGGVVVDVGSHIGWYSIIAGQRVGANGQVISIEPDISNFKLLCRNIKDNKLTNVIPLRVALSNKEGYTKLNLSRSPAGHSIIYNASEKHIVVKARRLDNILEDLNIEKVDLLKIDVEGAEFKVLEGCSKLLKCAPTMIIETSFPSKLKRFMKKRDYKIIPLDERNFYVYYK